MQEGKGRKEGEERKRLVVYINNQNLTTNVVPKLRSIGPSSSDTHTHVHTGEERGQLDDDIRNSKSKSNQSFNGTHERAANTRFDSTRHTISFFCHPSAATNSAVQHPTSSFELASKCPQLLFFTTYDAH
jgi:hypothetical protein